VRQVGVVGEEIIRGCCGEFINEDDKHRRNERYINNLYVKRVRKIYLTSYELCGEHFLLCAYLCLLY